MREMEVVEALVSVDVGERGCARNGVHCECAWGLWAVEVVKGLVFDVSHLKEEG